MAYSISKKRYFINKGLNLSIFNMPFLKRIIILVLTFITSSGIAQNAPIKLIVLDPGHGHATYMQGRMYNGLDPEVHVYAPVGPDVETYLKSINGMNSRSSNPTK